jgi:hypothetical protein
MISTTTLSIQLIMTKPTGNTARRRLAATDAPSVLAVINSVDRPRAAGPEPI